MLRNLNVFIPCAVLGCMVLGAPLGILATILLGKLLHIAHAVGYAFYGAYGVVVLGLCLLWFKEGLTPSAVSPQRAGRSRWGHILLAVTNGLVGLAILIPFGIAAAFGSQYGMLAWFAMPVIAWAFLAWPAGLFMVWSSRA